MTRDQFKYIVVALSSNYKNFGFEAKEQFDFWYSMLKDLDYAIAEAAVKKLVCESPYPPTIADIRKAAADVSSPKLQSASDAWGEITSAIRNYGWYNVVGALDSMSPLTRKVAKIMGFRELCLSENQMADRAHFLKLYETLERREKADRALPEPLKNDIKALQGKQEVDGNIRLIADKMSF
ncbi:MAG: hypothetical protein GX957_00695 [Clostridiaceae bacterium]|nr:hypothetical protein [Clostridiaceae bacterium]